MPARKSYIVLLSWLLFWRFGWLLNPVPFAVWAWRGWTHADLPARL